MLASIGLGQNASIKLTLEVLDAFENEKIYFHFIMTLDFKSLDILLTSLMNCVICKIFITLGNFLFYCRGSNA